jgi:hypothetical protein
MIDPNPFCVVLAFAAALLLLSGCSLSNPAIFEDRSAATQQVTFVSSPNREHVAVLFRIELHGTARLWAWYKNEPVKGTSLAVLDNDPPYTVGSKDQPIMYRRLVFTSRCEPQDFVVRWVDNDSVSVATRCPSDKLHPSGTPANGINVAYTRLQ